MVLSEEEKEELGNLLELFNSGDISAAEQKRLRELFKKEEEGVPPPSDSEKDLNEFTPPPSPRDEKRNKKRRNTTFRQQAVDIAGEDDELKALIEKRKRITGKFLDDLKQKKQRKSQLETTTTTTTTTTAPKTPSKETRDLVKEVKENLDTISKSEAQKQQLKEITEKREKTKKDKEILKKALEEGVPSPSDGAPKPEPDKKPDPQGRPAGAPIVKVKKTIEKLPELQFPSTTIVLAKKFSGKTNLLLNVFDKNKFDNVWVVSLTGFTGKLDGLCEDEECLLEDVSDTMINELLKLHKESPMNSLIVFDDVIGQVDMRSKGMNKLATMGRNFGISIVISAQDFFKVPPVWRRNSEYWYIGSLTDSNIEAASKELSVPSFTKKRIRQELSEIARDKNHDWLFYDDRNTKFKKLFGNQFRVIV